MSTVYTIDGSRGRRRSGGGGSSQRARFKRAAKECKGRPLRDFRACMRKKLK
jgi:hypothetical protein